MLRTLLLLTILCSVFWFGSGYVAEEFPADAGRAALTFIVGCTVLAIAPRKSSATNFANEFEVLNHKLDRINSVVLDIQRNPVIEFIPRKKDS